MTAHREARLHADPTGPAAGEAPSGFHHDTFRRTIGHGPEAFDRARRGIEEWVQHRHGGVEVEPHDRPPTVDDTVAILTRQLGLWVLAACRVVAVVDEPDRYGFTYATLPDHPERGWESFEVALVQGEVVFEIQAVSRPGIAIVRLGEPVTRQLQRRAVDAYLDALARFVAAG